jgi:23S rRNA pseudouridine1911/1915/1917 synthase
MLSIKKGAYLDEPAVEDFGEIVHRLDRDTSGVIIVAKNPETKSYLQRQFAERKTHKTYYAVVVGAPKQDHAIINVPLTRNLKKPTTFIPDPNGREAITEYKVIAQNSRFSLVELRPRTGRTHQLRIHMAHIKTPILGDPVYNPKSPKADRMYLHATSLEITIPGSKRMTFTAPLPESFRDAVK